MHDPRLETEILRQWREGLGIEVRLESSDANSERVEIRVSGWSPDYPDPDTFLRAGESLLALREKGRHDREYEELVKRAAQSSDRGERMRLTREADRHLVDQALVVPLLYNGISPVFRQPWVSNLKLMDVPWDFSRVRILEERKPGG